MSPKGRRQQRRRLCPPPGLVPGLCRWREATSLAGGVVVGGGLVICCFMEDFELYGTHDGGPGWLLEDRGDAVSRAAVRVLKFTKEL